MPFLSFSLGFKGFTDRKRYSIKRLAVQMHLHFDKHWKGGVSEFLSPARWQQQLHLRPEALR
jgi:hypothetical protein